MRTQVVRPARSTDLRRSIERLEALPIRPASARFVLDTTREPAERDTETEPPTRTREDCSARSVPSMEIDPGWAFAASRAESAPASLLDLRLVAELPWWSRSEGVAAEAISVLWRNSVATSLAARRLAKDAGDPDPRRVARAALLSRLGLWVWAALDPRTFADWIAETEDRRRRLLERERLGGDASLVGLRLAERLRCDPLVVEACWLSERPAATPLDDTRDLSPLSWIRDAQALADRTPWSLASNGSGESDQTEPRLRLLIAEVQSRCGGPFVDPDASQREERFTRENARLRLQVAGLLDVGHRQKGFLDAFAELGPRADPDSWGEKAALAWCDEPGIAAARVVWLDSGDESSAFPVLPRPASLVIPLSDGQRSVAEIQLWTDGASSTPSLDDHATLAAWEAWAVGVSTRLRADERLESCVNAIRGGIDRSEPEPRRSKLEALAEFAAGAGHELNNPLAVIVGRAQLLLARQTDPDTIRSLRAIMGQAQRTSRILRDLMYFARPSPPRPKICQPDEVLRSAVRDLQGDAETREVRLTLEVRGEGPTKTWADPDALRQIADCLVRNALEATPTGGHVAVGSATDDRRFSWNIHDSGKGVGPDETLHLFDPFYCGRQAGRGLGLGLPRISRILENTRGELSWASTPGRGTRFEVSFPLVQPPKPIALISTDADKVAGTA